MAKKMSVYMIAVLLDLAIKGVKGAIRAITVIRDLVDDGKINGSVDTPDFMSELLPILDELILILDSLKYPAEAAGALSADFMDDADVEGHA